jgi:uncharacterized protein YndB with AHSA1/START domain
MYNESNKINTMKTIYTLADDKKTLIAERSFTAPLEKVWQAWTDNTVLEKWWAPLPWHARTQSFEFKEGGAWHYYMEGPAGEKHWCLNSYLLITPHASFTAVDSFCNEAGEVDESLPTSHWDVQFDTEGEVTTVIVTSTYASEKDLDTVITMGMKEGFNQGLDQLEELLQNNSF